MSNAVFFRRMRMYLLYLVLFMGVIITIGPFVWMVLSSFKSGGEIVRTPPTFFPEEPTLNNYRRVLTGIPFVRYFFNSLYVSTLTTIIVLFTSSLAGYIFAKFEFPFRETIFVVFLSTLIIPFELIMTPLYLIFSNLRLINTYTALILPYVVNVFGIYLVRQFMHQIPNDLIDAARIDGCSEFRIFAEIIVPQMKPALATLGIFTFMSQWNNYLWPLIAINDMLLRPLQVGLAMVTQSQPTTTLYDISMAASTLAVGPVIVVFLIFQRWFIEGLTLTGLK
ncbi:MAG: carbohydrate ABC transporter permease [Firmicutes bacterium]|nr:carbohydrate ABC transporter permease [Bacillota bacterium]